jgi:hypothetical protein
MMLQCHLRPIIIALRSSRPKKNPGMSLPLFFKKEGLIERHQLEGTDPSDRYFNRSIFVNRTAQGYTGTVTYEALTVTGNTKPTIAAAVASVVEKLQQLGFTKMRTRPNFRGQRYLAEKETWVDYPDSQPGT